MRHALSALLVVAALAGCSQAKLPNVVDNHANSERVSSRDVSGLDLATALLRFTQFEKRKVTANHVTSTGGRAGATLAVPLDAAAHAVLLQLYRLTPQQSDPASWPTGLMDRALDHLAVLHHFQMPTDAPTDVSGMKALVKPRQYMDGSGKVQAFEAFVRVSNSYQILGKYDLQGHILQIDMDTWQAVP
jgi:hypothetical protein